MMEFDLVVIIEDDTITSFLQEREVKKKLHPKSIKIFNEAAAGLQFISRLIENNLKLPDLILLDLNMPVMDGWEFLNNLLLYPGTRVPVAIVSSSIDPADIEKTKVFSNVLGFISKPFEAEKLMMLYS